MLRSKPRLIALGFFVAFWVGVFGVAQAAAQQRPLLTEDVDIIKPGAIRIEAGVNFFQDQNFPLSGFKGDLTQLGDTRLSFGMSPNIEFQIEWTAHNILSIKGRTPSSIALNPSITNSTSDFGDASLWMKMKLRNESGASPALGFRFGVELPNSNQSKGIGTNTTNFYGMVTVGKHFMNGRLNMFGNVGLGILQTPLANFSQNDVLLYGAAGIFKVNDRLNLLGEVNGYHSTRKDTPLGTEDLSETRLGAQIKALGLQWYAAGVFGLTNRSPKTGLAIGVSYDWQVFTPVH
jgi:hypothetical protein